MLIGYARVSTQDQDNAAQISALRSAGCELMLQEKATGGRWEYIVCSGYCAKGMF